MEQKIDKIWTKEEIKENLQKDDRWVVHGILAIYKLQTADEQESDETNHTNGVGFSGIDAPIMSSFAKQLLQNKTLTIKQMAIARKKVIKYAKQLTKIANKEL